MASEGAFPWEASITLMGGSSHFAIDRPKQKTTVETRISEKSALYMDRYLGWQKFAGLGMKSN
jgi:hypothetical protein